MLRRFAATAVCVLALEIAFSHPPVSGPSDASIVSAAMAAREQPKPNNLLLSLRVKYELLPDDERGPIESISAATEETMIERAGKAAMTAIDAVQKFTGITKEEPLMDPGLDMRPAPVVWPKLTREETCAAMELAALEHNLPMDFFGRLIWQESRHNPNAVSHAGARGIAQFMPATAADMGLQDAFDPVASLMKSAQFLKLLNDKFGNVGLAAAAYNGGPGRLERWLEAREKAAKKKKKPSLPEETQNYVRIITGKPVEEWIGVEGEKSAQLKHKKTVPCVPKPAPVIEAKAATAPVKVASLDNDAALKAIAEAASQWNVQVTGEWSKAKAREQFDALKKKYPAMLGARRPSVSSAKADKGKPATLIRLAAASQEEGQQLCKKLKETGGSCTVQKIRTANKS